MMTRINRPLVLITGSSGLIGSRLARSLSEDYKVIGADLNPPDDGDPRVPWIRCDLTNDSSVRDAMAELRAEHGSHLASIVHLAAYYDFSGEPSPMYEKLTVEGTERLLDGLQDFEVEQFIFSSSLLVMKPAEDDEPMTADSPVEAEWDYPKSKLAAESVIRQKRRNIPALVLRIAGVYDEDGHSIPIAQQISRIHQRQLESYLFPGDKTHGQSFVHLDDVIACISAAIARRAKLPPYEVLLVGEEDVMSYQELQEQIGLLIHGKEWPTIRIPKPLAKAGAWMKDKLATGKDDAPFIKPWMIDLADQHYPVDVRKAHQLLGWRPKHTLRETLPTIVSRLRDDPQHWYAVNGLPVPESVARREQHEESRR